MIDGNGKLINGECRIETCNSCNSACTICPREKMTRPKITMSFWHFWNLVSQVRALGADTISAFGYGEPLLDPDIVGKVAYCTKEGLKTFITTNASLLNTNAAFGLLRAGLSHIRFSVHGIFDNYEKVHKGLKFNDTLRNIANFSKINKVQFDHACRVDVTVIPMHGETVDEILSFWRSMVDHIEIWRPHNWVSGRTYRPLKRILKSCGRPYNGPVQIQADGKMIICCFDTNGELTVGDTYKESIENILKGDRFNEIRRQHASGDLSGLICQRCDQLNIEEASPLLYSTIDNEINKTSSTKFKLHVEEIN